MKRKITLFIAAAATLPIALIAAVARAGVKQSLLGMTRRANGSEQVTYGGHPLYRFIEDREPGQTNGEGSQAFGAGWEVLSPAGKKIESGG
jgi:predicted lipoprotein with Yx(FWY)xxD motif